MKICYAFLIADKINAENIWKEYFKDHKTDYSIQIHAHKDSYETNLEHLVINQVETSWEQTIKAHFAHFAQFLQDPKNTHLVLLSESCIPVKSSHHVASFLKEKDADLWTYLSRHPKKKYQSWWSKKNKFRKTNHIRDVATAEQWYILKRETIEILYENKDTILEELKNVGADNEVLLTYVKRFVNNYTHPHGRFFYVDWPSYGSHPKKFDRVDLAQFIHQPKILFTRKVVEGVKVDNLKILKQKFKKMKVAIHLHAFHVKPSIEILNLLSRFAKFDYDLHVTYSSLPKKTYEIIKHHATTMTKVENYGFDIKPFLQLALDNKFDDYDIVIKLHSKKHRAWRNQLVLPLLRNLQNFQMVEHKTAKIAYAKKYCFDQSHEWLNTEIINQILTEFNIPPQEDFHFCGGTMFIVNKKYVELLKSLNLDLDKFNHEIKSDGTYSHAFERIFGYLVPFKDHILLK